MAQRPAAAMGSRAAGLAIGGLLLLHLAAGLAYVFRGAFTTDESIFLYSGQLAIEGQIPYGDFLFHHPPASLYILGATGALFGRTLVVGRFTSMAFVVASLLMMFAICWRRAGAGAALICALLMAANLQFVSEAYQANCLAPAIFFCMASLFVLTGGLRQPWRYLVATALLCLAIGTRVAMLPVLPFLWLYVWLDSPQPRRDWAAAVLLGAAILGAGFVLFYGLSAGKMMFGLIRYHMLLVPLEVRSGPLRWRLTWAAAMLQSQALIHLLLLIVLIGAVGRWIRRGHRPDWRGHRWALLMLGSYAGMTLLHVLSPLPLPSHQMAALPLAAMFVSVGVVQAWSGLSLQWRQLLACAMIGAAAWQCTVQEYDLDDSGGRYAPAEIRHAARVIDRVSGPGDMLLATEAILAYESGRTLLPGLNMSGLSFLPNSEADTRLCLQYGFMNHALLDRYICERRAMVVCLAKSELAALGRPAGAALREHYELVELIPAFGQWRETLGIFRLRGGAA